MDMPGAVEAAASIREGRRSALDLTEQCLSMIERRNEELQAFVHLDADGARRQAEQVDALLAAEGPDALGPLAGVPFGVKDLEALQYAEFGTAKLAVDQTLGTALIQISFGLSYQMSALPKGSAAAFQEALAADLVKVCGVALASRIRMLSLQAGSVISSFLIAPPLSSGDISTDTAIDNFIGAARDTSSALYDDEKSPTAAAIIRDSVRVQFRFVNRAP